MTNYFLIQFPFDNWNSLFINDEELLVPSVCICSGYEVKGYELKLPAEEGFLISEPAVSRWTFTATKEGEKQSSQNIYTDVFEREIKRFFKTFSKI